MTTLRAPVTPAPARAAAAFDRGARRLVDMLATPTGLAISAFVVAFALRVVFLDRAWDIFVDEITYLAIARNIAEGRGLTVYGDPFFLHPPAFLIVEGAITSLTGLPEHPIDQVQAVRLINVVLGSIATSAMFLLARRVAGTPAGVLAALLFGIDAFVIRTNSRNYLETFALLWIIVGYLVLLGGRGDLDRVGRRRAAIAGMAFGVALLTKDMTFFLSMAPLGLAFLWGQVLPRRRAFLAGVVTMLVYSLYPIAIALDGHGPELAGQKLRGLFRFLGLVQETGFNRSGGPSFLDAVLANLGTLGTTYAIIAIGLPAAVILLRWGSGGAGTLRRARMVGLWGITAYLLVVYSVAFGTLEEQFFFFLVVPAIAAVSVATVAVYRTRETWSRRLAGPRRAAGVARAVRIVVAVGLALFVAWSMTAWTLVHFRPDDSYEGVAHWLHDNAPRGSGLGVTDEPGKFLYEGYEIHGVATPDDVVRTGVDHVLLSTKQIRAGYTPGGAELRAWLEDHGTLVFLSEGPSYERMELYRVGGPVATPADPAVPAGSPLPGGDLPWVLVPVTVVTGLAAVLLLRLRRPGDARDRGALAERSAARSAAGVAAATVCVGALTLLLVTAMLPASGPALVGGPIDEPPTVIPQASARPSAFRGPVEQPGRQAADSGSIHIGPPVPSGIFSGAVNGRP
jgi:hypothetical protein